MVDSLDKISRYIKFLNKRTDVNLVFAFLVIFNIFRKINTNIKFIMKNGTVKFFNSEKGFGFIKEENGNEIFVHVSGLIDEIRENDQVVYEVQEGKKGLNAVKVKLA
jgi:CspA family cold shock protein